MQTRNLPTIRALRPAWNKGRIVGQKRPLKPKHAWAIRVDIVQGEDMGARSLLKTEFSNTPGEGIQVSGTTRNIESEASFSKGEA